MDLLVMLHMHKRISRWDFRTNECSKGIFGSTRMTCSEDAACPCRFTVHTTAAASLARIMPFSAASDLSLQDAINDPVEAVDILRSEFVSKTQRMECGRKWNVVVVPNLSGSAVLVLSSRGRACQAVRSKESGRVFCFIRFRQLGFQLCEQMAWRSD